MRVFHIRREIILSQLPIKILFPADTHLGFDQPQRPRVERRRRGPDFFDNYLRCLQPALNRAVDMVVHGGDLFFRSRVHPKIVNEAFQPLIEIADKGIPVFLVPGNHERSNIPVTLLETHPNIHIFNRPKTFVQEIKSRTIALAGFPFFRGAIQQQFALILEQTGFRQSEADIRVLCLHQAVEGAQVGVQNYTFRFANDVILGRQIPGDFDAVLSGHIHRFQVLKQDLAGRQLNAPVFYPGSIERTSFAERNEAKGYLILKFCENRNDLEWEFIELPTRPMVVISLENNFIDFDRLEAWLREKVKNIDPNSIVQLRIQADFPASFQQKLTAQFLRSIAPETMNIDLSFFRSR